MPSPPSEASSWPAVRGSLKDLAPRVMFLPPCSFACHVAPRPFFLRVTQTVAVFAWSPSVSLSQSSCVRCLIPLARASTFCPVRQTLSRVFEAVAAILPGECAPRSSSAARKPKPNQNTPVEEGMNGGCGPRGAAMARKAKTQKVPRVRDIVPHTGHNAI
eukprot:358961-Chlamydomonas_euryale.AAC.1